MGRIRRANFERAKEDPRDQDTLLPCPACQGKGYHLEETASQYRKLICRWCSGTGGVVRHAYRAFKRIERIFKLAEIKGRPLKK